LGPIIFSYSRIEKAEKGYFSGPFWARYKNIILGKKIKISREIFSKRKPHFPFEKAEKTKRKQPFSSSHSGKS